MPVITVCNPALWEYSGDNLIKDWKDGKIGEDGAFIYDTTAKSLDGQAYDGNEEAGTIWNEQALFSQQAFYSHRQVDHSVLRLLT